jgi:hypothetical protein
MHACFRAVNPISRWQWNGGFRPDSGPSRDDPCRRAIRPMGAFMAAIRNGCFTLKPVKLIGRFGAGGRYNPKPPWGLARPLNDMDATHRRPDSTHSPPCATPTKF